jgi:hypothetical protein
MWVRLKATKYIEVRGKLTRFPPGAWVQVGKQTARQWLAAGEAEIDPDDARAHPEVQVRRKVYAHPPQAARLGPVEGAPAFTIFAVPMGFQRQHKLKQENALASWLLLEPRPEVVLFGDEPGIAEAARAFGCLHLPRLAYNEHGTPIVTDAFARAQRLVGPLEVLVYVNSDIILLPDWAEALARVSYHFKDFLMVGQRWDVDLTHPLRFTQGWEKRLRGLVASSGQRHGPGAIDYFAFRPGLYDPEEMPPFAIGRSAWDNWLVAYALSRGAQVVDASGAATVVHQDKGSTPEGGDPVREEEKRLNKAMYEGLKGRCGYSGTIRDADWALERNGEIRGKHAVDAVHHPAGV